MASTRDSSSKGRQDERMLVSRLQATAGRMRGTIKEFYKLTHSTGGAIVPHPFRGRSRLKWASGAGAFLLFGLQARLVQPAGVDSTGLQRRFGAGDGRLYGNTHNNRAKQGFGEFHVSFFKGGYMPDKGTANNVASTGKNRSKKTAI